MRFQSREEWDAYSALWNQMFQKGFQPGDVAEIGWWEATEALVSDWGSTYTVSALQRRRYG